MRLWGRLALILWLLTGLLSAPAMAQGMTCHGGMDGMAMASDMPLTMPMAHKSMPHADHGSKNAEQKAFACAVHCLSAGAGFVLPFATENRPVVARLTPSPVLVHSLHGQIPGPPLEPPISAFV